MRSTTKPPLHATPDPALAARVVRRTPLRYRDGPHEGLDRPGHVRAGSGLARVGNRLVVVQDDANFLAVVDPDSGEADAVPLPAGEGGRRQFDDTRGNKHHKLDLEAVFVAPDANGEPLLVALGSGSTEKRERIVVACWRDAAPPTITVHDSSALYAALRADADFAPGELNVEGAVYVDGVVRLFARGNGAASDGRGATCEIAWEAFRTHLVHGGPAPSPTRAIGYVLGDLDGLALGFTDGAVASDGRTVLFAAAAEDSPDVTRDGRVAGSVIGALGVGASARWALLHDATGGPSIAKVEGIVAVPGASHQLYAVVDQDDPEVPSELCTIELGGDWLRA